MKFVNALIPKSEYKETYKQGNFTIVHFDATEDGDFVKCVETMVKDYNEDEVNTAYNEWKQQVNDNKLALAKIIKIRSISNYDTSSNVNSFSIQGVSMWLSRNDRNALMRRFEAEKANGIETTTLWYGTTKFELSIDTAITMLNQIEVYACTCYDVTAAHKAAVSELTSLEDINNYDFTVGYPNKVTL